MRRAGPHETLTLHIDELVAGGHGLARDDAAGGVVLVPRTAPGDVVEAAVDPTSRPARGRLLRVVSSGPDRVLAPCPWVEACGGCDWMHVSADAQVRAHAAIVRSALARAIGAERVPPVRVHPPASATAYRERARLSVRARRGRVTVGFFAPGSHDVVEVDACLVLHPVLGTALGEISCERSERRGEAEGRAKNLIAALVEGSDGQGEARLGRGAGDLPVVDLVWRGHLAASTFAAADSAVNVGRWAGVRIRVEGATQAATFGDPRAVAGGADGAPLLLPPGGFSQTSSAGAAGLAARVAELAAPAGRKVVELFSGSGTLSILLARDAASFTSVEIDAEAAACARANLAARGLSGKVVVADADAWSIPRATEVLVLDPPRTGARGAAREIAASHPKTVVYVSCDPATLARDVATLAAARYAITDVETFELFPQTSHVETVVRLSRAAVKAPPRA